MEHQPIDIDYQPIRDDDYIEDSVIVRSLIKIVEANQDFWLTLFLKPSLLAKNDIVHDSINWNSRRNSIREGRANVGNLDCNGPRF